MLANKNLKVSRLTRFLPFLIIFDLICGISGEFESTVNVVTTSGRVKGYTINLTDFDAVADVEEDKRYVVRFYGIRYAEMPTRFAASKPLLHRNESLDSNRFINDDRHPAACPQTGHLPEFSDPSLPQGGMSTDEDCLKLNVYSPAAVTKMDNKDKLPILIWVPGDGFNFADIVQYDGSALALKGNILVFTVNYRVGVFGFMSSGNASLPGNAGLHDILNAIKWVRRNAEEFWGDPDKITVAGRFSGSMALSALAVSPLFLQQGNNIFANKPLARRMILHGGIATGRYVLDFEPLESLDHLADLTHCKGISLNESIDCLQNISAEKLLTESMKIPQLWKPVIDQELILGDPLLQMEDNKFPQEMDLLIGDNLGAGSICVLTHTYQDKTGLLDKIKNDTLNETELRRLVGHSLHEFFNSPEDQMAGLAGVATHEYLYSAVRSSLDKENSHPPNCTPSITTTNKSFRTAYLRFCGVMYIRHAIEMAARAISERAKSRVFRYEWAYSSSQSHFNLNWHPKGSIGEEVIFLFPHSQPRNRTKLSKTDQELQNKFMKSWIDFIDEGAPWQQFTKENWKAKLFVANGMKSSTTSYLSQDIHFWSEVMGPLFKSLRDMRDDGARMKQCPHFSACPTPSILSHSLQAIVIFVAVALGLLVLYFFWKNWAKPRSAWKF